MADNPSVIIGGDSSEAQKAIAAATQALKDGVNGMTAPLQTMTDMFGKFKGLLLGVSAALAGGAMFKESISAANDWNDAVLKLSKSMGTSTAEASIMAVAINHIGVSQETLSAASMMLSRQMNSNANAFEVLGVEIKDTETGAFRPLSEVMADVNERLKGIHNTTQQNIAGMQVYGRGWNDLKKILQLTPEAMAEAEAKARSLHLIIGDEGVAQTKKYKEEQRDLSLVVKSLEIQIGNALLPVLVKLGSWMGEEGPQMADVFTKCLQTVVATAQTVWSTLKVIGQSLGGLLAADAEILHGNFKRAAAILVDIKNENAKIAGEVANIWKHAYDSVVPPSKPGPGKSGGDEPALDFSKGKEPKGPNEQDKRLQEWKNQLDKMKEAEGSYFKDSKQMEESFWQTKLQQVQGNGLKEQQIRRSIEHELYNIHKAQALQSRALDVEELDAQKNQASYLIEVKRTELRHKQEMGEISETQMLAGERKFAEEVYNIELKALDAKMELYSEDLVAYKKLQEEKLEAARNFQRAVGKIDDDIAVRNQKKLEEMFTSITQTIGSSLQGLVQKTQTLRQTMQNILNQMLTAFVSYCAKQLAKWAATELLKTSLLKSGTLLRTSLEKMGLLETEDASLTSNATKAASTIASADEEIVAVAPVAASKAASAEADIPYVGPILAVAAFAAMLAMILGSRGHAVGSWDVPGDMITKIHKGEMIIPEQFAQNMREGGTMGGGGATNIHIHAVDAKSVTRLLQDNASGFSQVARRLGRNFSPQKA